LKSAIAVSEARLSGSTFFRERIPNAAAFPVERRTSELRRDEGDRDMKTIAITLCAAAVLTVALFAGGDTGKPNSNDQSNERSVVAIAKGAKWLASVQGKDGGWGQDGGETSYVRQGEHLESNGNDVANTAVAALALRRAGKQYQPEINRAIDFIMRNVENSPQEGLTVTRVNGTQIQRKLGPFIDTFLTSMLLSEIDGNMQTSSENLRVRKALEKCVAKIQSNQQGDGSWNIAGGWAPILGTSMASRSLFVAKEKGVKVEDRVMARADKYTVDSLDVRASAGGSGGGGRVAAATPAAAGVPLYQSAQALEQLSRTEKDRKTNAPQIAAIKTQLGNAQFVNGFGSMGGEEFFSYLNISDSLRRTGGEEWNKWHAQITAKVLGLQNNDGTWAGSHCITGRVATTSAAILNLAPPPDAPLKNASK
jgi:Squalene-hopene cyclase C-terminal domain